MKRSSLVVAAIAVSRNACVWLILLAVPAWAGGPVKASGTLYFIFDMASETTVDGVLFARFVPDAKSLNNFPAVTSGQHPGPVRYISLEPAEEILETTLGRTEAYRVSHGAVPREIEMPVEVVLTNFKPEVECDSRTYYAKLVSVKTTGKHVASLANVPHGC
jgi:hypothetical protein